MIILLMYSTLQHSLLSIKALEKILKLIYSTSGNHQPTGGWSFPKSRLFLFKQISGVNLLHDHSVDATISH